MASSTTKIPGLRLSILHTNGDNDIPQQSADGNDLAVCDKSVLRKSASKKPEATVIRHATQSSTKSSIPPCSPSSKVKPLSAFKKTSSSTQDNSILKFSTPTKPSLRDLPPPTQSSSPCMRSSTASSSLSRSKEVTAQSQPSGNVLHSSSSSCIPSSVPKLNLGSILQSRDDEEPYIPQEKQLPDADDASLSQTCAPKASDNAAKSVKKKLVVDDDDEEDTGGYYCYRNISKKESDKFESLLKRLAAPYAKEVRKIWDRMREAQQNCEAMAFRGHRLLDQVNGHFGQYKEAAQAKEDALKKKVKSLEEELAACKEKLAVLEQDQAQDDERDVRRQKDVSHADQRVRASLKLFASRTKEEDEFSDAIKNLSQQLSFVQPPSNEILELDIELDDDIL